jgi:hypothetical protein
MGVGWPQANAVRNNVQDIEGLQPAAYTRAGTETASKPTLQREHPVKSRQTAHFVPASQIIRGQERNGVCGKPLVPPRRLAEL